MGAFTNGLKKTKAALKRFACTQMTMFGIDPQEKKEEPEPLMMSLDFSGNQVRVVQVNGEPWWIADDVCKILGIQNTSQAVNGNPTQSNSGLDPDERGLYSIYSTDTNRKQQTLCVNESGLYALLFRSRRQEAREFQKWVTGEVLPSIRKTGFYAVAGANQHNSRHQARLENKQQNIKDHARLKRQGASVQLYAALHNSKYMGVFQRTAAELRRVCGLSKRATPLDRMGSVPLSMLTHTSYVCEKIFEDAEKAGRAIPLAEQPDILKQKAREVRDDTLASLGVGYQISVFDEANGSVIDVEQKSLSQQDRITLNGPEELPRKDCA